MDNKKKQKYYTGPWQVHPSKVYMYSEVSASEDKTCEESSSSLGSTREASGPVWTEGQFMEVLNMCEHTDRYRKHDNWMVHVFRTGRRYAVALNRVEYNRVEMLWKRQGDDREHVTCIQPNCAIDSPEARSILRQMYDDIKKKQWK